MGISSSQYQAIMHQYDMTRTKNQHILDKRIEELHERIPELAQIQSTLVSLSLQQARSELTAPDKAAASIQDYHNQMQALTARKASLLSEHGYPADYLSPIYTCKDCKDTGMIQHKPCHCLLEIETSILYANSNLEDILSEENFNTFQEAFYDDTEKDANLELTPRENITRLRKICLQFIQQFDHNYDNMIFYGAAGVGKTFLTHCIAKELLDTGHSVIYLTALHLIDLLEKTKFHRDEASLYQSAQVDDLLHCDLLIIDDLGTEMTNSFTNSQLYYLMEDRHVSRKATIFSTNLPFQELHDRYGERIFSRFTGYYNFYKIVGDDIRTTKRFLKS